MASGAIWGFASIGCFRWRGTTVIPHRRPTQLVAGGPYSISRNPMYVALTVVYCGGAIVIARAWPLVLLPGPLIFLHRIIIPSEERMLREAFGETYVDYCRRVRRWL